MQELYRIKPLKMLAWWIACSLFIFPLSMIVMGMISLPTIYILSVIFPNVSEPLGIILSLLAVPAAGAVIGLCIAFLQRWVLRTKLYWAADKWYRWTIVGGALGAGMVGISSIPFASFYYGSGDDFLYGMPIFLAVVSAFQVIALRHAVKQAWLWIIANIIGGVVFAGLIINNQPAYTSSGDQLFVISIVFFAVVALGLITGFVLLFLFENKLLPMRPEGDEDEAKEAKPKSVWDRAI